MAKTKSIKKSRAAHATSVVMRYVSDPGHGWVEVPVALLKKLRLGTDFTRRDDYCYLEEDDEATRLDSALKRHGVDATFASHEVDDFDAWLGGGVWPYIPASVYGDDVDLILYALDSLATQMKQCAKDPTTTAAERSLFNQQWADLGRLSLTFSTMKGAK